jgi:hypothetical protein
MNPAGRMPGTGAVPVLKASFGSLSALKDAFGTPNALKASFRALP